MVFMGTDELWVFSAGAVAPPLQEALRLFEKRERVVCRLTAGKPEELLKAIGLNRRGDVISCGAEYVHDEAEDAGILAKGTRRSLGLRRSVIVVQPGNPVGIGSLEDLCAEGVRIGVAVGGCLKGVWDDVCSKAGLTERIRENIVEHADACGTLMGLIHQGKVEAVFGWNAFKNIWPDTCDVIELPREIQVFRSTAVQVITYTRDEGLSKRLIDLLTSPEVKRIYEEYGWIQSM